jgi:hypothetical protein
MHASSAVLLFCGGSQKRGAAARTLLRSRRRQWLDTPVLEGHCTTLHTTRPFTLSVVSKPSLAPFLRPWDYPGACVLTSGVFLGIMVRFPEPWSWYM